jgi:hypothetical protein
MLPYIPPQREYYVRRMKPPQIYNDTQLQAIEKSLAAIGVDLSAVIFNERDSLRDVSERIAAYKNVPLRLLRLWIPAYNIPLRDALQWIAAYNTPKSPKTSRVTISIGFSSRYSMQWTDEKKRTPKQQAESLKDEIEKLEAAVSVLSPFIKCESDLELATNDPPRPAVDEPIVRRQLIELIADRRRLRDALVVQNQSSTNARKKHREFWRQLTLLWQKLPATKKWQHKHLQDFLRACSKPLFPTETTDNALVSFTEEISPRTKV